VLPTIVLFEDAASPQFYPLSLVRPVCDLASGIFTFYERVCALYPQHPIEILCRPEIRKVVQESGRALFDEAGFKNAENYAFINARAALEGRIDLEQPVALIKDGALVYLRARAGQLDAWQVADFLDGSCIEKARALALPTINIPHHIYNYLWEISNRIADAIEADCALSAPLSTRHEQPGVAIIGERAHIAPGAEVDPGCVLDARAGAVMIKSGARVSQCSVIAGPAVIGEDARIDGARLHDGVYIGRGCRVGGEVEASVILDWSNKHHDGFLGHAYLGSWVNIGALTTNSDLRNDYGKISVSLEGKRCPSGEIKLGCLIGDHAKLGIGLMLNTGMVIGPGVNLYFDGALFAGEVPPFIWGGSKPYTEYRLEKFLATADTVMGRRGLAMGSAMRERLVALHAASREFRGGFLA
jgi:UDP-N-acetylglucosamine diphosphorylase/glucosamine-1-phosphate N-acetyltransferase